MSIPIVRRALYAFRFLVARQQLISGEFERAFTTAEAIFLDYGCDGPCEKVPPIANALAAWNIRKPLQTFDGCELAARQLSARLEGKQSTRSRTELIYMMFYLKYLLQFAESDFGDAPNIELAKLRAYSGQIIEVDGIDKLFTQSFPIESGWLQAQWRAA